MMADWRIVPETVLVDIGSYLPLRDLINASFVCKDWLENLASCFDTVRIDSSTPSSNSGTEATTALFDDMSRLIGDLLMCTHGIKHLNINGTYTREEDVVRILSSQNGIVTFRYCNNSYRTEHCLIKQLIIGMLKQKKTLSVVDINLTGNFKQLPHLSEVYRDEGVSIMFPNLASFKFSPMSALGNNFSIIFEESFARNKMKEIGEATEWLIKSLKSLLEKGNFSEATILDRKISVEESNIIMKQCRQIKCFGNKFRIYDDDSSKSQLHEMVEYYQKIKG